MLALALAASLAAFEQNLGQTDCEVEFVARIPGAQVFLTRRELVLAGGNDEVTLSLTGAEGSRPLEGLEPTGSLTHYLKGPDPGRWIGGVQSYSRVLLPGAWPGIDLEVRFTAAGQLELVLRVAPGADLAAAGFTVASGSDLSFGPGGEIVAGPLAIGRPRAFEGGREVPARFELHGGRSFSIFAERRAPLVPLLVDPVLAWSTYLGGSADDTVSDLFVDAAGNTWATGGTSSIDFPRTTPPGAKGGFDAFVSRYDTAGQLRFSTLIGGTLDDWGNGLQADAAGNVWLAGQTVSRDFPVVNAFQPVYGGAATDGFVLKLATDGSGLVWSTYLGGDGWEWCFGVAVDPAGGIWTAGSTGSFNWPLVRPLQAALSGNFDAFVTRLSPDGQSLTFSTYLGGSDEDRATAVALDASGMPILTGFTDSPDFPVTPGVVQPARLGTFESAWVSGIDPSSATLRFSTYLGGSSPGIQQWGLGIDVDPQGFIHVCGQTPAPDFPLVNPVQGAFRGGIWDGFAARLDPAATRLVWSTYLGGTEIDTASDIRARPDGSSVITGYTASTEFPLRWPFQPRLAGPGDLFVTEIAADGTLLCSSYFGGSGDDGGYALALAADGGVVLGGRGSSTDFPLANPAQPTFAGGSGDGIVSRFEPCGAAPGDVGDTLLGVRLGGDELWVWTDLSLARGYELHDELVKSGPFANIAGAAASGIPGLRLALPAPPLVFYRVAAGNCCGEGPL